MYKSKLQELCQRRIWDLPEYTAVKDDPDHVHGQLFAGPIVERNSAGCPPMNPLTVSSVKSYHFADNSSQNIQPTATTEKLQAATCPESTLKLAGCPSMNPLMVSSIDRCSFSGNLSQNVQPTATTEKHQAATDEDVLHMYKNLLQQYAQKENLGFPAYTSEAEGPPHARRFKSKVSVNGKSYEALEFFPTLKEAEQAAAKIACLSLSVDAIQEEKALYKNLLQRFVQKKGLICPSYETVTSGLSHKPIFVSTVEIGSTSFQGGEAKTRKQAEMNAAKVAYYVLTKGCPPTNPLTVSSVKSCHFADNSSQNIQPTATTKKLQAATCPESTLKLAGCPSMNPLMVSSIDRCPFSGNLSQNVQPTATTEKHQAATDEDVLHMYKNLLQQYAQKENLGFPVYTSEAEGPPHARRFKSKVSVNGKSYEALEFFPTLKEAEQATAKIACLSLSVDAIQEDKALYKNLLQEFVQKKGLMCPSYETVTSGLSHKPIFVSTVEIGSTSFQGGEAKTRKQAEMNAAKVAYYVLTKGCPPTNPLTVSSVKSCHFAENSSQNIQPTATTQKLQAATCPESTLKLAGFPSMNPLMVSSIDRCSFSGNLSQNVQPTATTEKHQAATDEDVLHMYKNLLQQYAQKENLGFPVYTSEAEGPPHARRFKSKVSVNGKSYEALEFFPTLKEAEQAAAKIACLSLSVDAIQEDKALYKNLLQEFVQKKGLICPSYETVTSGLSHKPIFVSTVEIGTTSFQGGEAKTRKQAEMNAAKVAHYALTKGCPPTNPLTVSSVKSCHFADNSSQNIQPTATTEKLQAATCPESTLKLAGCPSMNPLMVSSIDRCLFSGNLSQNVQPTATTEKHQAATDKDGHQNTKRAKSVPDNVDVSAGLHANSNMGDTTTTESGSSGQRGDNKLLSQWKTVVCPRKSNRPIPENGTVMPYSDDRWVAYRVS